MSSLDDEGDNDNNDDDDDNDDDYRGGGGGDGEGRGGCNGSGKRGGMAPGWLLRLEMIHMATYWMIPPLMR